MSSRACGACHDPISHDLSGAAYTCPCVAVPAVSPSPVSWWAAAHCLESLPGARTSLWMVGRDAPAPSGHYTGAGPQSPSAKDLRGGGRVERSLRIPPRPASRSVKDPRGGGRLSARCASHLALPQDQPRTRGEAVGLNTRCVSRLALLQDRSRSLGKVVGLSACASHLCPTMRVREIRIW